MATKTRVAVWICRFVRISNILSTTKVYRLLVFQSLSSKNIKACSIPYLVQTNKNNIFITRPSMEISTKTHLAELSTMVHVVRNQIKCILVNERPREISLARLRDLICRVYQSVNRDEKTHSAFQITYDLRIWINRIFSKSSEFGKLWHIICSRDLPWLIWFC